MSIAGYIGRPLDIRSPAVAAAARALRIQDRERHGRVHKQWDYRAKAHMMLLRRVRVWGRERRYCRICKRDTFYQCPYPVRCLICGRQRR